MQSQERKQKFIDLLVEILSRESGIKAKLAEKLGINPSTLTGWFQGKVDPASLEILTFTRIAEIKGCSVDELAEYFQLFSEEFETPLKKLRRLILETLIGQSQEQLSEKLEISQNTLKNWLNPAKTIDPGKISAKTIASLAREKKWTIETVLTHLNLIKVRNQANLLSKLQIEASTLALTEQTSFLIWLSEEVDKKVRRAQKIDEITAQIPNKQVCLFFEQEDLALASYYSGNLVLHLHLQPENISIATPRSLPESLSLFDLLLFDLNNQQSPCIPLIESLEFDGDVVAFVDRSLPEDIQDRLKQKVTEVIVKPVLWSELKRQPYFS